MFRVSVLVRVKPRIASNEIGGFRQTLMSCHLAMLPGVRFADTECFSVGDRHRWIALDLALESESDWWYAKCSAEWCELIDGTKDVLDWESSSESREQPTAGCARIPRVRHPFAALETVRIAA